MSTVAILADLATWWADLPGPRQLFLSVALVAGVIAAVLTVLALVGLDGAASPEFDTGDIGGDAEGFSLRAVTGFFLGFGVAGYAASGQGLGTAAASGVALAVGCSMFFVIRTIMRSFGKLKADGTLRYADAVGSTGVVYVEIPGAGISGGQASVTFSGRYETLPAITRGVGLVSGTRVKVVAVEGRVLVVEAV